MYVSHRQFEFCELREAPALPVFLEPARDHTWELRNEGGDKGVHKMGYVSSRVGETMGIGPVLPEVRCGVLLASLAYLQSWRNSSGSFSVQCKGGCECHPEPGTWAKGSSEDMRYVRTFKPKVKATITVDLRFILAKYGPSCWVHITHLQREDQHVNPNPWVKHGVKHGVKRLDNGPPSKPTPTRVRIDGIQFTAVGCRQVCFMMMRTQSRVMPHLGQMARNCSNYAGRGSGQVLGFLGPSCLANATTPSAGFDACKLEDQKDMTNASGHKAEIISTV